MSRGSYSAGAGAPRHQAGIRGPFADAAGSDAGITPEIMLDAISDFLRRRGLIAISLGLIVGAVAIYFSLAFLPPTYTATAAVAIAAPPDYQRPEQFKETMVNFIRIDEVLTLALDMKEAKALPFVQNSSNPIEILRKWIKVDSTPLSDLVYVSLEGSDPQEITVLVNAVVDAYLVKSKDIKTQGNTDIERDLKQQQKKFTDDIKKLNDDIRDTVNKRAGLFTLEQVKQEILAKQEELKLAVKTQDEAIGRFQSTKSDIEAKKKEDPALLPPEQQLQLLLSSSETAKKLQDRRDAYHQEAQREAGASRDGTDSVGYQQKMAMVRECDRRLEQAKQEVLGPLIESRKLAHRQQLEKLEGDLALQLERKRDADQRVNGLNSKIQSLRTLDLELTPTAKDYARSVDELNRAETKLRNIQEQTGSKYISKINSATVPQIPARSKARLALIAFSGLGGLAIVVVAFWFMDFRLKLVTNPEHLQRQMSVSVLGILPWVPKNKRLPTDSDFDDRSRSKKQWQAMQDGINSLRITLTFAPDRAGEGLSSLMITSARDGEGKSTLSGSLSVSLARSGVKIILVDADLYRPVQHTTFDLPRGPGLSDVLNGTVKLENAIKETAYPNLFLLPAGTHVDHVDSLLTNERLRTVFDELKRQYATVIIDAPPVLPVYDTLIFGQQADQTILCAMCNHSQVFLLRQAQQKMESVGIPVMGIVVAGATAGSRYKYYYYAYNKGYQRAMTPLPANDPKPVADPRDKQSQNGQDKESPNGNGATHHAEPPQRQVEHAQQSS